MMRIVICITILSLVLISQPSSSAEIISNGVTFTINDEMQSKYSELIKLILNTESMDDDERQYWFDIMPSMTNAQNDRLFIILETERKKLESLEKKFQKVLKSLNEKHLNELTIFKYKEVLNKKGISLCYSSKVDCLGSTFVLKLINKESELDINNFINLKQLIHLNQNKSLTISDEMNLIEYSRFIIDNLNEYSELYSVEDVTEFIEHVNYVAIKFDDVGFLDELVSRIEDGVILFKNKQNKLHTLYSYYLMRDKYDKALNLYDSALDQYIASIANNNPYINSWVSSLSTITFLMPIEAMPKYKHKAREIIKKYLNVVVKNQKSLDHAARKGRTQTRLILLDIVKTIYYDLLSEQQKTLIGQYLYNQKNNKKYFSSIDGDWYFDLTQAYFDGNIKNLYEDYKNNIDAMSQKGYMLDGVIVESGIYYAFKLYKEEKFTEATQVLNYLKLFGRSFKSPAKQYIEKDIGNGLQAYINNRTSLQGVINDQIKKMHSANFAVILSLLSGFIIMIMYLALIVFPYWKIFRSKAFEKFFLNKLLLAPASPIIIHRILNHCLNHLFPKIPFIPLTYRINKNEFIERYISISLQHADNYVDEMITNGINNNSIHSACIYGEGGMGKTLTAYKVSFNLSKKGYLPILLDATSLSENIEVDSINILIGEYFGNNHIISVLSRLGFSKYVIIVDNVVTEKIASILSGLQGTCPESIIIFTTRNTTVCSVVDLAVELNSKTVNFEGYIQDSLENRIKAYKSFILEIKNILLISIISNNEIDIVDIVRNDSNSELLENKILEKYVDFQIDSICDKYLPNIKHSHSSYLINRMFCLLSTSNKGRLSVAEYLSIIDMELESDKYLEEILSLVISDTIYKSKIQIIDLIENSAILYIDSQHIVRFTHDLINEFLTKKCRTDPPSKNWSSS